MTAPSTIGARRPSPLSIRLSTDERAQLEARAGHQPLGGYIKSVLFSDTAPRRRAAVRSSLQDSRRLAQLLAELGASRLASNLNQLAHAANIGSLVCDDEVRAELVGACADIASMRSMLVAALGLKSGKLAPPPEPPRRAFSLATGGET